MSLENHHNPERQSPEIVVSLPGLGEVALNYYNTTIFTFDEPFADLDHAYVDQHPEEQTGEAAYVFGRKDVLEALKDNLFPQSHQPWPSEMDTEVYVRWRMSQVDDDLRNLAQGTESE